jgi:hypothetical protein
VADFCAVKQILYLLFIIAIGESMLWSGRLSTKRSCSKARQRSHVDSHPVGIATVANFHRAYLRSNIPACGQVNATKPPVVPVAFAIVHHVTLLHPHYLILGASIGSPIVIRLADTIRRISHISVRCNWPCDATMLVRPARIMAFTHLAPMTSELARICTLPFAF